MINKYRFIAEEIRRGIASGHWKPGDRLPTQAELRQRYQTTIATVQKAMEELQQGNFAMACGKSGTFVTEQPPNLFHYAVVFPVAFVDPSNWDTLWASFVAQQRELEARFHCRLLFYYLDEGNSESQEYRHLAADAESGRLAGAIFPFLPSEYLLAPLIAAGIPCVAVTRDRLEKTSTVWVDYGSFFLRAFDRLLADGRKRIAVLCEVRMPRDYIAALCRYAEEKGAPIPPAFLLGYRLEPLSLPWLDGLLELLLRGDESERPDGLILANENFRDHLLHVLQQKKLVPGKDVGIVLHTNFPSAISNPFPIHRIGFRVDEIVGACLNVLAEYRKTGAVDHSTLVPVFEEKPSRR